MARKLNPRGTRSSVFEAVSTPPSSKSTEPENLGVASTPVTAKGENIGLIVGTYAGWVNNQTVHQSAGFAIFVRSDAGKVEGCMGVQKPLIGSGTLHGQVKGSMIEFTVNADTFDLFFRGNIVNNTITGTYNVSPINGAVQDGDFYLERTDAEVPSDEYVQDCLTDAEMNDK